MILLASRSPRRRELLGQIGVQHEAMPVNVDETWHPGEPAETYVRRITLAKAERARQLRPDLPALAADTAVVLADRPFGKPRDEAHAVKMLLALSGRTHLVMSGVALATAQKRAYRLSTSRVTFAAISREQARRYWATGEPIDKAGGYAIQGRAALFIRHIAGSYSGIMGLPLFETGQLLAEAGLLEV